MRARRVAGLVTFGLLLVLVLIGVAWWLSYSTSPRYALGQAASAASAGDWETFTEYVDVSEVTSDIAEQIIAQRLSSEGLLDDGIEGALADAVRPVLAEEVRSELRTAVESQAASDNPGERIGAFFYTYDPKEMSVRGSQATVTVNVPYRGEDREVRLQMRHVDGRWRVVRVLEIGGLVRGQ